MQEISIANSFPSTLSDLGSMSDDEFREWECARENAKRVEPDEKYGIDCAICGNKGQLVTWDRDEQCMRWSTCRCEHTRHSLQLLDKSGVCPDWRCKTLESFCINEEWRQALKLKIEAYLADTSRCWLFVSGQSGCGKTHLCTAVFVTLVRAGHIGRCVSWSRLMQKMDAAYYKNDEYKKIVDPLLSCDVLYLDDLFKSRGNAIISERAFDHTLRLLDARYQNPDLITILSSEWTVERLTGEDEALAGRIVERCGTHIVQVAKAEGRNYRIYRSDGQGARSR